MSSTLLPCLFLSVVVAAGAAGLALWVGWGWVLALVVYSFAGSVTLVGAALGLAVMREWTPNRRASRRAGPARPVVPAL